MAEKQKPLQLAWGVLLILAGIGVFYRMPQILPEIQKIPQFSASMAFIRFCFYFIGIVLIGGGLKKIIKHGRKHQKQNPSKADE